MSEWFSVKDILPDPNTEVEVMFSLVAVGDPVRASWPCVFHPEGSSPPMFIFRSHLDEHHPGLCGEIIAWRLRRSADLLSREEK